MLVNSSIKYNTLKTYNQVYEEKGNK
jgi:hypothetical protein